MTLQLDPGGELDNSCQSGIISHSFIGVHSIGVGVGWVLAPQALAVNGLERCVASRHTQNNTDLAVTPGDTMSGRGIWPYSLIQLRSLKAQLVLAVSLVEDLRFLGQDKFLYLCF
jgi:hypothetical protein